MQLYSHMLPTDSPAYEGGVRQTGQLLLWRMATIRASPQRAQNPLTEAYILSHIRIPLMIYVKVYVILNSGALGSLGP